MDIVDDEFLKTIAVKKHRNKTDILLRTIYVPPDLKQLSGFLPKQNYETDRVRAMQKKGLTRNNSKMDSNRD